VFIQGPRQFDRGLEKNLRSTQTQHQTFPSITVPRAEVEGLKPGQRANVVFAKRTKTGHVMNTWPDTYTKKYITFRATTMKPADAGYP